MKLPVSSFGLGAKRSLTDFVRLVTGLPDFPQAFVVAELVRLLRRVPRNDCNKNKLVKSPEKGSLIMQRFTHYEALARVYV